MVCGPAASIRPIVGDLPAGGAVGAGGDPGGGQELDAGGDGQPLGGSGGRAVDAGGAQQHPAGADVPQQVGWCPAGRAAARRAGSANGAGIFDSPATARRPAGWVGPSVSPACRSVCDASPAVHTGPVASRASAAVSATGGGVWRGRCAAGRTLRAGWAEAGRAPGRR